MRNGSISNDGCSSSTSLSSQQDVEDDRMIAVVLSEEYAKLDGAVGRRISSLAPVPHIPRINLHFPSSSDSNLDYQRLLQRLKVYGLYEVKVSGDGNCQLKDNHALYEGYVPMKFKSYYKKMAKSGEWGDHVTLQAAADKVGYSACFCGL
ncbi:UNVERIFIED_CONTAM: OVARIAN TUMOR DOMAIN-containing deubiquitinating enzyme 12 [Sesamum radiatum]|uniref:OVARIAN TUMOR DOMAIN-containing deubiquitinating enzyme 12 n=1 Tax=Sesamum radiatum TaxID=300843 RepID=A0AAW2P954_SESRA